MFKYIMIGMIMSTSALAGNSSKCFDVKNVDEFLTEKHMARLITFRGGDTETNREIWANPVTNEAVTIEFDRPLKKDDDIGCVRIVETYKSAIVDVDTSKKIVDALNDSKKPTTLQNFKKKERSY